MKEYDTNRLNEEYQIMVQGLRDASAQRDADLVLANPILPDDILQGIFHIKSISMFTYNHRYLIIIVRTRSDQNMIS